MLKCVINHSSVYFVNICLNATSCSFILCTLKWTFGPWITHSVSLRFSFSICVCVCVWFFFMTLPGLLFHTRHELIYWLNISWWGHGWLASAYLPIRKIRCLLFFATSAGCRLLFFATSAGCSFRGMKIMFLSPLACPCAVYEPWLVLGVMKHMIFMTEDLCLCVFQNVSSHSFSLITW